MHFRLLKAAATAALESIKEAKERKRERAGHPNRTQKKRECFNFFFRKRKLINA